MKQITPLFLASVTCLFSSCKNPSVFETSTESSQESKVIRSILTTVPTGIPSDIFATRISAKPGDAVIIKGRIMGSTSPFVIGRSAFILADPDILSACNDTPGYSCITPWDSCRSSPEERKGGTATIQITGSEGEVLRHPLEGSSGLSKLVSVTVSGKVAPGSSPDLLIVNATAIQATR